MNHSVRFAIAKYVPDLERMEPRNLGVVVWAKDGIAKARFLGETPGSAFRWPRIVTRDCRHAYKQWISYWRYYLNSGQIAGPKGEKVERSNPEFFDALVSKSKERFRLVDAGYYPHKLTDSEVNEFLDEMFVRLVETPNIHRSELHDLTAQCDKLLLPIKSPVQLQRGFPMPARVLGEHRNFTLDYCWADGAKPQAALQRVLLTRHQSYDSNALMFQALTQDGKLRKETCAALINGAQDIDDEGRAAIRILQKIVTVIDVSKPAASQQIQDIAERLAA